MASLLFPGIAAARPHALSPDEAFGTITRLETELHSAGKIRVDRNGNVTYQRLSSFPGAVQPPPINGTATSAELDALRQAIGDARFYEMPAHITPLSPFPSAIESFFRVVSNTTPTHDSDVTAQKGFAGPYQARLDGVDTALDSIRDRLLVLPPPARSFVQARLRTIRSGFGGMMLDRNITIRATGEVRVRAPHPLTDTGPTVVLTGTATDAELTELSQAIDLANMRTIPDPLPPVFRPMHLPVSNDRFMLRVSSANVGNVGETSGQLASFGQFDARLRPLVEAMDRIGSRILNTPPPTAQAFARVHLRTQLDDFSGQPVTRWISILVNGRIDVHIGYTGGAPPTLHSATATAAELRDVQAAVNLANMHTVPDPLPPVLAFLPVSNDRFFLSVSSSDANQIGRTSGWLDAFGQFDARLRPLVNLLERITRRVVIGTSPVGPPPPPVGPISPPVAQPTRTAPGILGSGALGN